MHGQQNVKIHSYSVEIKSQIILLAPMFVNLLEPPTCEQKETLLCLIEFGFVTEHAGVVTALWLVDRIRPVQISVILKFLVVFNQTLPREFRNRKVQLRTLCEQFILISGFHRALL